MKMKLKSFTERIASKSIYPFKCYTATNVPKLLTDSKKEDFETEIEGLYKK